LVHFNKFEDNATIRLFDEADMFRLDEEDEEDEGGSEAAAKVSPVATSGE